MSDTERDDGLTPVQRHRVDALVTAELLTKALNRSADSSLVITTSASGRDLYLIRDVDTAELLARVRWDDVGKRCYVQAEGWDRG